VDSGVSPLADFTTSVTAGTVAANLFRQVLVVRF